MADEEDYIVELRARAERLTALGRSGSASWFAREADKIERDPSHATTTRAILGVMKDAAPLLRKGKI